MKVNSNDNEYKIVICSIHILSKILILLTVNFAPSSNYLIY